MKEIAAALFHWIQKNIKYVSIKSSLSSSWTGHPAIETFENKYGDCTDLSILYSAMLNYAGITAYPVIVQTNDAGRLITEIPIPYGNHCITQIKFADKILFIDPTSETYRYPFLREDDNAVGFVNYITGEIGKTPLSPAKHNYKK